MRNGRGWSLLELLTVIAIIAILVALLFPVASRAKDAARRAACAANMSQLAKAMRLYALDYNDYLCFVRGKPANDPLCPGHYGTGYYLKRAMKDYVPDWDIWFCPSDRWAKKDFTCSANSFGTFNYTAAGVGYKGVDHALDTDAGICFLYSAQIRLYGKDDFYQDHNEMSYRRWGERGQPPDWQDDEGVPVYIDEVYRWYHPHWGVYGYWDINPSRCELFQEDLPMHRSGAGLAGLNGRIYGKNVAFRDGHAAFTIVEVHGFNNYGELPNDGE